MFWVKYTVVINTRDTETVYNALRFACAALSKGHKLSVFLLGPAVEIETIGDDRFNVKRQLQRYEELGGKSLSCGTCLAARNMEASESCPMSNMDELVRLTEEADRVVVFG